MTVMYSQMTTAYNEACHDIIPLSPTIAPP
jgi:hypothetical protein